MSPEYERGKPQLSADINLGLKKQHYGSVVYQVYSIVS